MACQGIGSGTGLLPFPRSRTTTNGARLTLRNITRSCLKYDRLQELKDFDATKQGVKGIADVKPTKLPRMFALSPEELAKDHPVADKKTAANFSVPVIDLGLVNDGQMADVVESIKQAAKDFGFFHIVNHGVPSSLLKGMLKKIRAFHELPVEEKMNLYDRNINKSVIYTSNFDLYKSKTASWRDSLTITVDKERPFNPLDLHIVCRDEVLEYSKHVKRVSRNLFVLFSMALGLPPAYLNDNIEPSELGHTHQCHYYPPCPQPELTLGLAKHTDPSFISFLLKDHKDGLQILHQDMWFDVAPVQDAILVVVGDYMQLLSNKKFSSCPHRAIATEFGPRVTVATFMGYFNMQRKFGPIKEILSENNEPVYKDISTDEYLAFLYNREVEYNIHALDQFMHQN